MEHHNNKFLGFTLPEVLITIGIIGVVAVMTLSPLITKIRNKGYAEKLIKTYSVLQNATNQIIAEDGEPKNWSWNSYNSSLGTYYGNELIVNKYKQHLKILQECGAEPGGSTVATKCHVAANKHRYLNGENGSASVSGFLWFYRSGRTFILQDGILVSISFLKDGSAVFWGSPDMLFTVDVNAKAGPNQVGRDVFFFYLKKTGDGKIMPYANETFPNGGIDYRNTCEPDLKGYSCAYRIITEGGMNY